MTALEKFRKCPKIDAHNHLNLGMHYDKYSTWAGFLIPNFPRKLNGLGEMHEIIGQYTRPRAQTQQDFIDLISMSIEDAIEDGVTVLEGSVDIQFVHHCGDSVDNFLKVVDSIRAKYEGKIDFRPELGLGKMFDKEKLKKWVIPSLDGKVFKSMDLYGPEVFEGLEDFKPFYEYAGKVGVKRKAHIGEFSDAQSVKQFIDYFELEEVQHGIGAAKDDKMLQFLADKKIRCNVTPWSNVMLGAVPSMAEHPIKKMHEAGIPVTLATDDLLFFNRTVSEQADDLVKAKVFTQKQMLEILKEGAK